MGMVKSMSSILGIYIMHLPKDSSGQKYPLSDTPIPKQLF